MKRPVLERKKVFISPQRKKELKKLRRINNDFAYDYKKSIDSHPSEINVNHAFNMINDKPRYFINFFTKTDPAGLMFSMLDADKITEFLLKNPGKRDEAIKLMQSKGKDISDCVFLNTKILTTARNVFLNKRFGLNYYNGSAKHGISNARVSEPLVNIHFLESVLQYNYASADAWKENYEQLTKKYKLPKSFKVSFDRYTRLSMNKKMLANLKLQIKSASAVMEKSVE